MEFIFSLLTFIDNFQELMTTSFMQNQLKVQEMPTKTAKLLMILKRGSGSIHKIEMQFVKK